MPRFVQDLTAGDPLNQLFYTTVSFFGVSIDVPRPTQEARAELQKYVALPAGQRPQSATPQGSAPQGDAEANLIRLLAEQDERVLDFVAAETDLQRFVERSNDKPAAYGVLADFYEQRLRFGDAVAALVRQAETAALDSGFRRNDGETGGLDSHVRGNDGGIADGTSALPGRVRYRAVQRAIGLIESRRLSAPDSLALRRRLLEWYPEEPLAYQELLTALLQRKQHREALALLERYREKFPRDPEYALHTQARLLEAQGNLDGALEVYSRNYQPRWSDSLVQGYLDLLRRARRFEPFVQALGQKLKQNPLDFPSVTLLFRGTLSQGNLEAARNALFHFRTEKENRNQPFADDELQTLAQYFDALNHFNEAARYFSTLALQTRDNAKKEESLYQLYQVMMAALNRPTQLGGGSLDYFQSVAALDTSPGLLNGMLSLLLNHTSPRLHYDAAEERAASYFNRARAAELLEFFEKSYANSAHLPRMQFQALEALKAYGRWETLAQRGTAFMERHPRALETPSAGILVADAYANLKNEAEEFRVYSRLLDLLNAQPHRFVAGPKVAVREQRDLSATTPVDAAGVDVPSSSEEGSSAAATTPELTASSSAVRDRVDAQTVRLRAVDYSHVVERTIARLTAAKRYLDVVALFRKELERNTNEEALYARFAEYLNQHRFFNEEMETYQQAINRFNKVAWYDKLARWYLRQKRQADFATLSKKFVDVFAGTELEAYFRDVVTQVRPNAFYEELNVYANRRFPHNPVFARNLADVYLSNSRTYPQWEAIAQRYFFEDKSIRERYYSYLSRLKRLQPMLTEMAAVPDRNLAQMRFLADAVAWGSQFEQAVPHYQTLAARYPTEPEIVNTTSDLLRSLGAFDVRHTAASAKLRDNLAQWNPADRETLTRIGETYADIEAYAAARDVWLRLPASNISDRSLHLEAATVFWDYYLFDDSLKAIQEYRRLANEPAAMAYEMGAIYEDGKDTEKVLAEYVQAAALGASTTPGEAESLAIPSSSEQGSAFVAGGDERAYKRLRFLALRRNLGNAIDTEFRQRVQADVPPYSFALAYSRHLGNLKRLDDLRKFLLERVSAASDRDFLNRVQPLIQQHGFYEVQEAGLKRLIALTTMADQQLPLQIELARFYESRNRVSDARAVLEQLHTANPKSLGLIQDLEAFYWRHQLRDRAIALLEQSVPLANVNYRKQFLFDQAQKLRTLKEYDRAVRLGQQLLKENPLDTGYSNFVAATLVQAGRHSDLPPFFTEQLQAVRQSKLSPEEQKSRILALRRGMVEAQVVLKDFTAALDQYIEMINMSAEDVAVVNEAAGFAEEHQVEPRLRRYCADTAQRSAKDHRWPLVLARLEDRWGHLTDSLTQYDAAIRIRPERIDLYEAKAGLQERLLDSASAVQTNQRLYELSYKNPSYLLKIADLEARLGRKAEAVDALKKAYAAEGGLPAPQYFAMVDTLNRWGFLEEAKPLIDEGWKRFTKRSASDAMGGRNLLRSAVEVSVKRRDAQNTLHALRTEYQRLDHVKEQPGGTQAYGNLEIIQQAFLDLGKAINAYFTPEEKLGFQAFLQQIQPPFSQAERETLAVPLAEAARLPDFEESLRLSIVARDAQRLTGSSDENESVYRQHRQQLVEFYRRRQAYEKAIASLVSLWEQNPQRRRLFADLVEPALAARKLGNAAQEAAVLEKYAQVSGGLYDPAVLGRYYELLAELKQDAMITQISQTDRRMIPALVNALIDRNNLTLARTVLQNYGRRKTPVWTTTQLAMTGAELKDSTPQVAAAFSSVLNLKPIGEQLGVPADAGRLLYGAEWYFYARSYGMHLHRLKDAQAEAYLPAQIEFAPVSAARQAQVGELRLQNNELSPAIAHFEQALELEPASLQGLDGQAVVWMKQGQTDKATANWLKLLASQEELFSFPKMQRVLERVREFKLEATFHEPFEKFLKTYVKRNQTYGIGVVLPPALELFGSAEEKVALLTRLAGQTEAFPFVEQLLRLPSVEGGRLSLQPLYEAAIGWQRTRLGSLGGEDQSFQQGQLREFEFKFAEYLLQTAVRTQPAPRGSAAGSASPSPGLRPPSPSGRGAGGEGRQMEPDTSSGMARAETLLASLEQEYAPPAQNEMVPASDPVFRRIQFLKAQLYLQTNRAEPAKSLLQSLYQRAEPITSRKEDYLKAADLLAKARLLVAARAVRQEMYEELLRQDPLVNAHPVGLAEVHLESKQPAKALAVLERMRHSGTANEEGHRLAAQLLWKYRSTRLEAASPVTLGDKAKEVWRDLLKINPFATDDRLQLAEAIGKPGLAESQALLKSILESRASTYAQQIEVARIAGRIGAQGLNFAVAELRFIAALETWRSVPKPTTPAPPLPALPDAYYAPIYAASAAGNAAALPFLDNLRRALYLSPSGGQKVGMDSRLFAALIRGFDRAKRPGLLVDLFEQHGGGYGPRLFQYTDVHRGREAESGNPLEGSDTEEVTGPPPLTAISMSAAEKVALMKLVIAAYSSLQADDLAAQLARNSAALLLSNRQAFLAQARQLEDKARQSAEALAARFSVNDTLGEELSRRKPVSRPRRERVRS